VAAILIIEDEPDQRELLTKVLERDGHHVTCASNGWEGLLALDARNVDLVVLDLMMPGMDGATFLGVLRNDTRRRNLPVLVVTALREEGLVLRARQIGVQEVLRKTRYTPGDLSEAVRAHLSNHHSSTGTGAAYHSPN